MQVSPLKPKGEGALANLRAVVRTAHGLLAEAQWGSRQGHTIVR